MSMNVQTENSENNKYVTVATYARLCGFEKPHAIYQRLDKQDVEILQVTKLKGVEGIFINTEKYPPKKYPRGWKPGKSRKKVQEETKKGFSEPAPPEEKISILNEVVKETVKEAPNNNRDATTFQKFMIRQHAKVSDQISLQDFAKLITNFPS